jgi:hypothetical protein
MAGEAGSAPEMTTGEAEPVPETMAGEAGSAPERMNSPLEIREVHLRGLGD